MIKVLFLSFPDKTRCFTGGAKVDIKYQEILEKFDDVETYNLTFEDAGFTGRRSINKKKLITVFSNYDIVLFDEAEITRFAFEINYIKRHSSIKLCPVLHHYLFLQYTGFKAFYMKFLERYLLKKMDEIIFSGEFPYDLAVEKRFLSKDNLFHIGIGIDDQAIVERQYTKKLNVLFVGHIMRRKGVHYLLKTINYLKSKGVKLDTTIIGDCNRDPIYTGELQDYIKKNELSSHVRLTGRISDEKKDEIYKKSDVFVFPSLCEGFGIVILEAMKHGIPAIVFDNTSLSYMVKDDVDGYVVPNKKWKALCEKLLFLYNNPEEYERLSEGAKKTYLSAMTWDKVVMNLKKWADR